MAAPRPPADAVVALRGLTRRFRGLFAGLEDDERPEDVALRPGADGRSALDHVVGATHVLASLGRGVQRALVEDGPLVEPAPPVAAGATGPVEARLAELDDTAQALAARIEHVPAADWARTVRVSDREGSTTALDLLWEAVDGAVAQLRATERVLAEVRQR